MKFHAKHARWFAYSLHLLLPGLGHVLWREFLFGLFIFLIMLIAVSLFFVAFFIPFGWLAKLLLFGMPTIFYVFSYFDLARTIRTRRVEYRPSTRRAQVLLLAGLTYFFLIPFAPGSFLIRNAPTLHTIDDNLVNPVYSRGDLTLVNRMSYSVDLFFLARPVVYDVPERFDVVRVELPDGRRIDAFMLGRPGEMVEIAEGIVFVNGAPEMPPAGSQITFDGDWPLTPVNAGSILVATTQQGAIYRTYDVPLEALIGRVSKVL